MMRDLFSVLFVWVLSFGWQFISMPFLLRWSKNWLADAGWSIGRVVGWLLLAGPIWYLAHLGLPINTRTGVWLLFIGFLLIALKTVQKHRQELTDIILPRKRLIIVEELLFFLGLLFLSIVRGYAPDINGLEKFMDHGLIVSYMKSPTLPIEDMWLSGFSFNYYTFGHYLGAIATQFWGLSPTIAYNLLLGLLMGLSLTQSAGIVMTLSQLTARKKGLLLRSFLVAGIIGAYLVTFGGNTQTAWYWLKNRTFEGYWYPDATRFIENTIHEFPAYSFIVSDLHAHVWSMALVLTLIPIIIVWIQKLVSSDAKKSTNWLLPAGAIGVLLGMILSTSTWDGLIYALFLSILSTLVLITNIKHFSRLFISGLIVGLTMLLAASPWWMNFSSISEGVSFVPERTPVWQLITLWIGHVGVSLLAAVLILIRKTRQKAATLDIGHLLVLACILTGITLIILPEIIYFIDIYTTQPRANTMFKLTYGGFILLSLSVAWLVGYLISLRKTLPLSQRVVFGSATALMIAAVAIYPYFGYRDYYNRLKVYQGLDGVQWLKAQHPTDYEAILWLDRHVSGRPVVLEAVGDSYTTFARVSTFTGLPTVLGWRVHEWLWRGSYDLPGKRSGEVELMYQQPTSPQASELFNEYQVKYIFIGDKEREAYFNLDQAGLESLGRIIFREENTIIIERNG